MPTAERTKKGWMQYVHKSASCQQEVQGSAADKCATAKCSQSPFELFTLSCLDFMGTQMRNASACAINDRRHQFFAEGTVVGVAGPLLRAEYVGEVDV